VVRRFARFAPLEESRTAYGAKKRQGRQIFLVQNFRPLGNVSLSEDP
jgi:hypothetical protein